MFLNQSMDLIKKHLILGLMKRQRIFFCDNGIRRKCVSQGMTYHGLTREIRDRYRTIILFFQQFGRDRRLDHLTNPGGGPDGGQSRFQFI